MPIEAAKLQVTVESNALKVDAEIRQLGKSVDDTGKKSGSLSPLSDALTSLQSSILPATAIVVGFGAAVNQAYQFGEAGAQSQRLREASANLAQGMGSDMGEIVNAVRSASMGTVTDLDIIRAASRAMMLGVSADAEQLANLMQVAAFRGRAMGLSTTQAFSDIVTGVGRMSPLILDNLGIVVDAEASYSKYAISIGKTAAELTSAEKRQALLNRVLEEGNRMMEASGGLAADNATKFEQLSANWGNLSNRMKEWAAGPAGNVVTALNVILTYSDGINTALEQQEGWLLANSSSYEQYVEGMIDAGIAAGRLHEYYRMHADDWRESAPALEYLIQTMGIYTEATWEGIHAQSNDVGVKTLLASVNREAAQATADLAQSQERAIDAPNRLAEAYDGAAEAAGRLRDAEQNWKDSTGDDIVRQLEQAGIKGTEYKEAIEVLDEEYGTGFGMQDAYKESVKQLVAEYQKSGDLEKFRQGLGKIKDEFMPMTAEVIKARVQLETMEATLKRLTSQTWKIAIEMGAPIPNVTPSYNNPGSNPTVSNPGGGIPDNLPGGPGGANGLDMIVPAGYPNDSYPLRASSGERVLIIPQDEVGENRRLLVNVNLYASISSNLDVEEIAWRTAAVIQERL